MATDPHALAHPLTAEECRALLGWEDASEKDIEEFLSSLRTMLSRFLDDYFRDEMSIDSPV